MTKQPKPDEIWREVDPRTERYVRIIGVDPSGVHIRSVWKINGVWKAKYRSRIAIANPARFNGKSGGYAFVEEAYP
jgi:hypothetical protein